VVLFLLLYQTLPDPSAATMMRLTFLLSLTISFLYGRPFGLGSEIALPLDPEVDLAEFHIFLDACTTGRVGEVKSILAKNPSWAKRNDLGETCLHAAGIQGQMEVTRAVLLAGGDPNLWVAGMDEKHKIQALSFHIFGGHVDSAKLLLEYGADPNALITSSNESIKTQTVLDLVLQTIKSDEGNDETPGCHLSYYELKDMLVAKGAKTYYELTSHTQRDEL
jgi:hypothetical protein